jgi:hypothetical protein
VMMSINQEIRNVSAILEWEVNSNDIY